MDECNVACILCDIDNRVVYINTLAKELMEGEKDFPYSVSLYEKTCGFFKKEAGNAWKC